VTEPEPAPITKAKSDIADLDRKISAIKAEEMRLALQRTGMERERERIKAFADMYPRYTGSPEPSEDKDVQLAASSQVTSAAQSSLSINGEDHTVTPESKAAVSSGRAEAAQRLPRKAAKRRQALYRKPSGTPKMTDMIAASLRDAHKRGLSGLRPKEMAEFIRQKWWPHLKSEAVSPIAWRMLKQGELAKNGPLYVLQSS
jgi:hypothetical protein